MILFVGVICISKNEKTDGIQFTTLYRDVVLRAVFYLHFIDILIGVIVTKTLK